MILGVDYGRRNIGLAVSQGEVAEPWGTIQVKNVRWGIKEIEKKIKGLAVEKVVVGVSEGKSRKMAEAFGKRVASVLGLPVEYVDETLSSLEVGLRFKPRSRKGREEGKRREHARAAAAILQRYLDEIKI